MRKLLFLGGGWLGQSQTLVVIEKEVRGNGLGRHSID